jgi:very-short-patch-repair endonuclease
MRQTLSQSHPEIASEWDQISNADLTPHNVSAFFKQAVWWKCKNNHSYKVSVYSRVRSKGCKICSFQFHGEKVRRAKLSSGCSIAEGRPDLLIEWNYNRNVLKPSEIAEKSHKKVWWKCQKAHEWEVSPHARARGTGCPTCSRENAGARVRKWRFKKAGISFATKYPDLLAEWDFKKNSFNPSELAPKSNVRAHWVCRFGHKWEASITNRSHNRSGCPFCSNQTSRLEVFLLCELRALFLRVEWRKKIDGVECDIYLPDISMAIEVDGEYWHRTKMEADRSKAVFLMSRGITLIRVRDSRLDALEGIHVPFIHSAPEIDASLNLISKIADSHPTERLREYIRQGVQINEVHYREIMARLPAPPTEKSLKDLFPELSNEWDYGVNSPLTPDLFVPGSDQKVGWVCLKGHRWNATIKNRAKNKSGCPICYSARIKAK